MSGFDLDSVIDTLKEGNQLAEPVLVQLFEKLMEVLFAENTVLELQSPITICGDIHGQLFDLLQLFETACSDGATMSDQKFLFMGDYVDRGRYSVTTFAYLAALKLKYPGHFYLLRGNHECRLVNQMYGFYAECQHYYGHAGIWAMCNEVFDLLPMAALIDNRVFSVHGGLAPQMPMIENISLVPRQRELPDKDPVSDLVWSDPEDVSSWQKNTRGAGWLFGARETKEFCRANNLDFMTRSHQLVEEGYKWWFDEKLITVWSAPNYMYRNKNKASVLKYDSATGRRDLLVFDAMPDEKRKNPDKDDPVPSGYFL